MVSEKPAGGPASPGIEIAFLSVYGAALCVGGIVLAAGGHGTYLLLGLAASPFSLLGIRSMVVASLLQWVALALAATRLRLKPVFVLLFLMVHYAVAVYLLFISETWHNEWYPPYSRLLLGCGMVWYVLGQIFVWRRIVLASHRQEPNR